MATVVYPQIVNTPNQWAGIGEGVGVLGNVLGQVVSKYKDRQLLDQTLEEAQKKYQAGDPTGLMQILSEVRTPDARQKIMDVIGMAPQGVYQQDADTGEVGKVGEIPAGGKLLPPDKQAQIMERQLAVEDKRMEKAKMQEGERTSRAEMREDARDARAQQHEIFKTRMQQDHEKFMLDLQDKRARNAKKEDYKKDGATAIFHFQQAKQAIRTNAAKQIKEAMGTIGAFNPKMLQERIKEINDGVAEDTQALHDTYGPIFQGYGYKVPGVTGAPPSAKGGDEGWINTLPKNVKKGQKAEDDKGNRYVFNGEKWVIQ